MMAQILCLVALHSPLFLTEGLNQKYGFHQSFNEQPKDLTHYQLVLLLSLFFGIITCCSVIKPVYVGGIYAYFEM